MLKVSDFDFDLPAALIAQHPPAARGASRLLTLDRMTGRLSHHQFSDLPSLLRPGDLLVVNDTRVFPARLIGTRVPGGGAAECLLVRPSETSPDQVGAHEHAEMWVALVHPGQRLRAGARMIFESGRLRLHAEIADLHFHGRRTVRLWTDDGTPVREAIDALGHVPLPPYIKRDDIAADRERYQTVYARARGSIAAPTAGLHFTPAVFDALARRGVMTVSVTLHVGYGTFQPVRVDRVDDHTVEEESYEVPTEAATALSQAAREGRRIIAVGTTSTRTLESVAVGPGGQVMAASGRTSLFVRPGHEFQLVSGLVTNFHLPRSSLLMLVAALGGVDFVLAAYREAIAKGYRFYSYGDAMLVV